MRRYCSHLTRFNLFVLGALLVSLSGVTAITAQLSAPLPSSSQVIAQSIELVDGGSMQWYTRFVEAPPTLADPFLSTNQFIYVDEGQIVVSREPAERELISAAQATYTSGTWQVNSMTSELAEATTISLIAESPPDQGIRSQPFTVEPGDYNLQLTRGVMRAGQTDTFLPVNDYPFFMIITSGAVSLSEPGSSDIHDLLTGDVTDWSGDTEIFTDGDATYLIASIGDKLPPIPAATGDVEMMFYLCPDTVIESADPAECAVLSDPLPAILTLNGITRNTTDGVVILPDSTFLLKEVQVGDWLYKAEIAEGSTGQPIVMSGDARQQGTDWLITVKPGATSAVHVMMVENDQGIDMGLLTVWFMECPTGWTPGLDISNCLASDSAPNLIVESVTASGVVFNTAWSATKIESGTYLMDQIPPGTYTLTLEFNDTWTSDSTYFISDAYTIEGSWYIEVPAEDIPVGVMVVHSPVGDDSVTQPNPDGTGGVIVTQTECDDWTAESACQFAVDPWDVYLTNIDSNEVFSLSANSTYLGAGRWIIYVPAGSYTVAVPDPGGWEIEYPLWVDVYDEGESHIYVRGNP